MPLMKALKMFRVSETKQVVSPGIEFRVSAGTARNYEQLGMAVVIHTQPKPNEEGATQNKAAEQGPLASPGGEIGADKPPSSSPADRAPRKSRSKAPEEKLAL